MYKLVWTRPDIDHVRKYGSYNHFPPNWHEVDEEELVSCSHYMSYTEALQELRQMMRTCDGKSQPYVSATLYFFPDGSGYAIQRDFHQKKFRYYLFGSCMHDYVEDDPKRRFIHSYTCKKCGYSFQVDSSDCHSYS